MLAFALASLLFCVQELDQFAYVVASNHLLEALGSEGVGIARLRHENDERLGLRQRRQFAHLLEQPGLALRECDLSLELNWNGLDFDALATSATMLATFLLPSR